MSESIRIFVSDALDAFLRLRHHLRIDHRPEMMVVHVDYPVILSCGGRESGVLRFRILRQMSLLDPKTRLRRRPTRFLLGVSANLERNRDRLAGISELALAVLD